MDDEPPKDQTARFQRKLERRKTKAIEQFTRFAGGRFARHCPNCGYFGKFSAFGYPPRYDAHCPSCSSLERHRLLRLYLDRLDVIHKTHKVLHFAPEQPISDNIRSRSGEYITTDYMREAVDLKLNIEALDLPDKSFDRIFCLHVMEHVDDRKALSELWRVLKPGGLAILATPIVEGWNETYEGPDPTSLTKSQRVLHYGQYDHVRYYGRDVRQRIQAAGFRLEEVTAVEPDVSKYGLMRGETIFLAWKDATK
ncbi:methyltransferase domain-containing protein [Pseudaestuariivita rosea]|uniref:methyltransferase domain-containing protein n=1 Tax=Pseudaestuariivita rosea TaxID=2763263 RepID=UPI001ABAEE7E|nr:class I SAM-dependent methyltransferase [Pseudaestuariivita rosea]